MKTNTTKESTTNIDTDIIESIETLIENLMSVFIQPGICGLGSSTSFNSDNFSEDNHEYILEYLKNENNAITVVPLQYEKIRKTSYCKLLAKYVLIGGTNEIKKLNT